MARIIKKLLGAYRRARIRPRIERTFKRRLGYAPDLRNPRTYCEKIQWLKLHHNANDPSIIERADKYRVRGVVERMGFAEHLVPLHGVYDRPEDIDWDALPARFVLKLNNASGARFRWFVDDKSRFPIPQFEKEARYRLDYDYASRYGELHYGKIPPKIVAEALLGRPGEKIVDYNFYCFHGKVAFLTVEEGRRERYSTAIDYFDTDWARLPYASPDDPPKPAAPFARPRKLQRMVRMAEVLSAGYPHVRVDLYHVDDRIYFGELTYTPDAGFIPWQPRELDYELGRLMDLGDITH
ncbi:MAG: hypothetical protein KDI88_01405 [Gammaproteobacteria bacterium]|nr:hypothetical protein [Gammaproteobacteria bacterium]